MTQNEVNTIIVNEMFNSSLANENGEVNWTKAEKAYNESGLDNHMSFSDLIHSFRKQGIVDIFIKWNGEYIARV